MSETPEKYADLPDLSERPFYSILCPWPVSTNRIWRCVKGRAIKSKEYRTWFESASLEIWATSKNQGALPDWLHFARLSCVVLLQPANHQQFDIDNKAKSLLDALENAGVIRSDSQIDELTLIRLPQAADRACLVTLMPHQAADRVSIGANHSRAS